MTKLHIAALIGFPGVALGAFGAHGLHDRLVANDRIATWDTAAFYHLIHAVILVILAISFPRAKLAFIFFTIGISVFSGSLYILALTNVKKLGMITPVGGFCLLAGWVTLALLSTPREIS